jgi:hypothetical protein
MWWKAIAREPLVHFAALGALLFAVDARHASPRPTTPPPATVTPAAEPKSSEPGTIRIDADRRKLLEAAAEKRVGRPPTPAEVDREIDAWIDEDVLYREAVARGLDKDDPIVHERIASRMSYVLDQALVVPEPTEAELRAWFDAHKDVWASPERVDFTHVFIANGDDARAKELEAALAAGAPSETLGDRFSGGHRYRGRKLDDLAEAFGPEFVAGLASQPPGTWVRRRSKHGLHLVRVDRVSAAQGADFAAARLDVRKSWLDDARGRALAAEIKKLRDGWKIER